MSAPRINLTRRQPEPEGCACHSGPATINAAMPAPPRLVSTADVEEAGYQALDQIRDLAVRLEALAEFAGSPVLAAPLEQVLNRARDRILELRALSVRAAGELQQRDEESQRLSATIGAMRTIAGGTSYTDFETGPVLFDAVNEVQWLLDERNAAREIAVQLEGENGRLTASHVEAAGLRAYLDEIEIALNTWRSSGKLGDTTVRRVRGNADRARNEARDSAAAQLVTEAVHSGEVVCLECGRASAALGICFCGSSAQAPASEVG